MISLLFILVFVTYLYCFQFSLCRLCCIEMLVIL